MLDEKQIRKLQQQVSGENAQPWDMTVTNLQGMIDSGTAWKMEGSVGRAAMDALDSGACFLPPDAYKDYWGNTVPSRESLKAGTKGTLENSAQFWAEQDLNG